MLLHIVPASLMLPLRCRLIRVNRTIEAGSKEAKAQEAKVLAAKKRTSLDHALSAIEKKKTVTTVTKTSADWDQFKEKEGISDELEQATKDG